MKNNQKKAEMRKDKTEKEEKNALVLRIFKSLCSSIDLCPISLRDTELIRLFLYYVCEHCYNVLGCLLLTRYTIKQQQQLDNQVGAESSYLKTR